MPKINIHPWQAGQGADFAHLLPITEFLIQKGFTPVFPLEKGDFASEPIHSKTEGRGWISEKGMSVWRCKEPIPSSLINENFGLPPTVRIWRDLGDSDIAICCDDTRTIVGRQ